MNESKEILIFVRSIKPYLSQRKDVDNIILKLVSLGHSINIYDVHQAKLINAQTKSEIGFSRLPNKFNNSWLRKVFNILALLTFCKSNQKRFDTVCIFFVREEFLLIPSQIKRLGNKLILFHYGSDINNRSWVKNKFTKLFHLADELLFTTPDLLKKQLSFIGDSSELKSKCKTILLPFEHLKDYKNVELSDKIKAKKLLNLPLDKPIVVLGSTSAPYEQQLPALREISSISENFYLYIPLSDRTKKHREYISSIEKYLTDNYPGDFLIQKEFKSLEYIKNLRYASDIYINMRTRDQLCLAMIESNLSYCNVITGNWLPYNWYTDRYKIVLIDALDQLSTSLMMTINENNKMSKLLKNRQLALDDFVKEDYYEPWLKSILK